jgi:hypothetical protein
MEEHGNILSPHYNHMNSYRCKAGHTHCFMLSMWYNDQAGSPAVRTLVRGDGIRADVVLLSCFEYAVYLDGQLDATHA